MGITSSAEGLKVCTLTAGIKTYKSIIKKNRNRHDNILFLAKTKLKTIEVLTSKTLIGLYINHDDLVSVNDMLREFHEIKKTSKIL